MSEEPFLLKNMYSPAFIRQVATEIFTVYPAFDQAQFTRRVFDDHWAQRELKQRIRHIAESLRPVLPQTFREAAVVLVRTVQNMQERDGERMTFEWSIFPDFIERYGADDPDCSLQALETLTQLSSAEFAIRPFLLRYPELTHQQMLAWAKHRSPWVRRLASEGYRPRLPWGMGIPALKKDPTRLLPILELLKDDPAETVRRSVANNLNDISKDHPDLLLHLASRWIGQNEAVDWIVRHACRGLLKKGEPRALALFGLEQGLAEVDVADLHCDKDVNIGGVLSFSFRFRNKAQKPQKIRLEYAIHYLTSSGKISRKVFQIKEVEFPAGHEEIIQKKQRFQDFTTRKHFVGEHKLDVVVNGVVLGSCDFEVKRQGKNC